MVVQTLNDLSQGEFDIVISDVESSTTQRQAQLWSLIDAVSKLGIPADLIFDTVIDLSDLPKKNDIKMRWQQQQQRQQEQAQQQMQTQIQIEEIKNRDFRQTISFKDAPFPIQLAMAAKAGYVAQEVADYFMQLMVQQLAPQLVAQMNQQQMLAQMQMQAQPPPNQQMPVQQGQVPAQAPMPAQAPNPQTMTQAAAQSVMNGIAPAAV